MGRIKRLITTIFRKINGYERGFDAGFLAGHKVAWKNLVELTRYNDGKLPHEFDRYPDGEPKRSIYGEL